MPDLGNSSVFSQTDSSNASGTMPSWSGSAAPSTIDDAGRAFQGAVTREWNWRNFTLTAGGTADAKTLTYSVAPAAYYNGQRFAFLANTVNTGSATLNVNSLGAKTIKKMIAGTATNLSAGDMVAGSYVEVAYNTAGDYFVWINGEGVTPQFTSIELGNASDTTLSRSSAGVMAVEGKTVPVNDTGTAATFGTIELGNASDTTISRSAAGVIAVEGGNIPKENRANTFTETQTISSAGSLLVAGSGGLGYSTGSGGSVTQLTSKATGVTLNKTNGVVIMNNASLAANTNVTFGLTNSTIAATDTILVCAKFSGGNYSAWVTDISAGSVFITVRNNSGGALSNAVEINFAVIKAVQA